MWGDVSYYITGGDKVEKEWYQTKPGRVVILVVAVACIISLFAFAFKLGQPGGGKYVDTSIYEVGGMLKTAKLFCYGDNCKWLITYEVTDVLVLQDGEGMLDAPEVGAIYTTDISDSKMNNYVVTQFVSEVHTPNVITYDYEILNEEIRLVVAEEYGTSSGLPEVYGAVR